MDNIQNGILIIIMAGVMDTILIAVLMNGYGIIEMHGYGMGTF